MHRIQMKLTVLVHRKMEALPGTKVILTVQTPVTAESRVTTPAILTIIPVKKLIPDIVMRQTATVTTEITPAIRNGNNKTTDQSDTDDFVRLTAPGFQIPGCFFWFIGIL